MRRSVSQDEDGEPQYAEDVAASTPVSDTSSDGALALEHSPAALGLTTLAGDLIYLNPRAERLFGLTPGADLAGRNLADICTETGQRATVEAVARDGHERQMYIHRKMNGAGTVRVLCKLTRIAGYEGIPTWLAFAGLGCDDPQAAVDEPLDEAESLAIMRRLMNLSAWKMRIEDYDHWADSPMRWGAGIESLLNLKPGGPKVTPRSFLDCIAREDREAIRAALEKSLLNGFRFEAVYRLTSRNGSSKIVFSRAALVADESAGSAPTLVGMVQDITSVLGGEVRPYEKAAILDTIAANLEAPVYAVDRDLRYIYFNSFFGLTMRQLYGVDPALGEKAFESVPDPGRRRTVLGYLRRALSGARVVEEVPICLDGSIVHRYELTYSPMRGAVATGGVAVFGVRSPRVP
jgi:PAS domain S-box-containing protein